MELQSRCLKEVWVMARQGKRKLTLLFRLGGGFE